MSREQDIIKSDLQPQLLVSIVRSKRMYECSATIYTYVHVTGWKHVQILLPLTELGVFT